MLTSLTAADFALLLLIVTVSLGGALVWAFWEMGRLVPLRARQIYRAANDTIKIHERP